MKLLSLSTWNWPQILLGVGIFLVTFVGSLGLTAWILVRLPRDYFHSSHAREFWTDKPAAVRWAGLVAKNLAGLLLVVLGIIMSLPGVPGQGLLTILLGLVLMDIPGKRPLESTVWAGAVDCVGGVTDFSSDMKLSFASISCILVWEAVTRSRSSLFSLSSFPI